MTKALVKSLFLASLLVFWAGCDDNGNGHEDADVDVTPDPQPDEVTPDPVDDDVTPDPVGDDVPEDVPVDTPEEETPGCPDDSPPDHIYIDVAGVIMSLDGTTDVVGSMAAAISPLDALTNPAPTPIGTSAVGTGGAFSMECMDVGPVSLGLVVLHDDDPSGTDNFYPTGTGVIGWLLPEEKVDVPAAVVFGISQTLAAGIETMTSIELDTQGLAMGVVITDDTHTPIDGATVERAGGDTLNVIYPTADFTGVETDGNTSANGVYIITDALTTIVSDITANATGYTFEEDHSAATKGGFIYFLPIQGTAE